MNKLKLNLDRLRVESFATDGAGSADRGTVQAHEPTTDSGVNTCFTCPPSGYGQTCGYHTCQQTCGITDGPVAGCVTWHWTCNSNQLECTVTSPSL